MGMRLICCFLAAFLLVACSPDVPPQEAVSTGSKTAVAAQSSSSASASALAPALPASVQSEGATGRGGFDGVVSLWSRVTGKEQDLPSEQASSAPPIKITPAAELINPFPTLRVVSPALASKNTAPPRNIPVRSGDLAQKRTLEQRPGDTVGRRAGDIQ
jgi:hypothetical protein